MTSRFVFLICALALSAGGCASVSDERVARLETAVMDLQLLDMRVAVLENTVDGLMPGNATGAAASVPGAATAQPAAPEKASQPAARSGAGEKPRSASAGKESPGAAKEYQKALAALESGNPKSAKEQFARFLAAYPVHSLAPNAGYWLGECHYTLKEYPAAIDVFKDVVAQYPAHDKAAAAMLKAGYSYAQLGDAANARFYLESLVRDFPASKPAALAQTRLAAL